MKRIYPVLSDRQLKRAHDRHVGGEAWKEIAPDFRCSHKVLGEQVNSWRHRNGITRRRGYTPPGYAGARPPRPSGNGGNYAGRRYEDDPRDPPTRNHIVLTGVTLPGSMMSSAAAMCAS